MLLASDEAGVPQRGGIFVKAIALRREDSRYSSDTAQSRGQCGERQTALCCSLSSGGHVNLSARSRFLIDDIAKQLAQHKLVPFFGAGVSSEHLGGIWKDISDAMADELGLSGADRADFLDVAEKYEKKFGNTGLCNFLSNRLIAKDFDDAKGRNHLLLLSFAAGVLYTTNQDNLFELAAAKKGRPHRIIVDLDDLGALLPGE